MKGRFDRSAVIRHFEVVNLVLFCHYCVTHYQAISLYTYKVLKQLNETNYVVGMLDGR